MKEMDRIKDSPRAKEVDLLEKEEFYSYYITPEYLERMRQRAFEWSDSFLQVQSGLFKKSIPECTEVQSVLKAELHRRKLNRFRQEIKKRPLEKLEQSLKSCQSEPDLCEMLHSEIEIRKGTDRLSGAEGESAVHVV